jgi:hypothetical protein
MAWRFSLVAATGQFARSLPKLFQSRSSQGMAAARLQVFATFAKGERSGQGR